jgi:hypothetical protein
MVALSRVCPGGGPEPDLAVDQCFFRFVPFDRVSGVWRSSVKRS